MSQTESNKTSNLKEQKPCINICQHILQKNCQVICISKNKKMLLIGEMNDLIIMNFTQCNGQFKQLNKLRGHRDEINSIKIINSDFEILTAGVDGCINIWRKNKQWQLFQSLKYNLQSCCLIVNKSENLLISQETRNINFWSKQDDDNWQFIQQIRPFKWGAIYHLELNDKCDTLVAANRSICIIQLQSNNIWEIIQNFNVLDGESLCKFCFIKHDLLAIFTQDSANIIFYQQDQDLTFNQIKHIEIQSDLKFDMKFEPQYSINKEQLIIKINQYIFFLKLNNNYDLIQQFEIESSFQNCKDLIIEEMSILICYNYFVGKEKRVFRIQNYKQFINFD